MNENTRLRVLNYEGRMPEGHRLRCFFCGKSVSTEFTPTPTDTPDKGLIVRALVVCPECVQKKILFLEDEK